MQPGAAGIEREIEIVVERIEVSCQQQFRVSGCDVELPVDLRESAAPGFRQIGGKNRFVDLNPFTHAGKLSDDFSIDGSDGIKFFPAVKPVHPLGERQEGHRADQHRLRIESGDNGFVGFCDDFTADEAGLKIFGNFRHDVVIVGVEPLSHLHRVKAGLLVAARHREIGFWRIYRQMAEAFRYAPEHHTAVEHMIVAGEVAGCDEVESRVFLDAPVVQPEFLGAIVELRGGRFAFPEGFKSFLELPFGPESREAEDVFLHSVVSFLLVE